MPVTDNQHVNAGDLLASIDDRDYRIAVDQAQAQVAIAQANVANIDAQIDSQQAQIDQAKAQLKQAEAQLQFAREEADRAGDLVQKGAGTVQRAQQTKSDLEAQQANNNRAKAAVIGTELGLKGRQNSKRTLNSIRLRSICNTPMFRQLNPPCRQAERSQGCFRDPWAEPYDVRAR